MVSHWSLSNSKSPQVSRILLSILAHLFSLFDLHSSSYFQVLQSQYQSFGDYTKCANYDWYHRYFHIPLFFISQARPRYLSLFLLSFSFTLRSAKIHYSASSLFFCCWFGSGCLAEIIWSDFISKSQRILCLIFLNRFWFMHMLLLLVVLLLLLQLLLLQFFKRALAGDLSVKCEWLQVFSSLQDSS